MSIEIFYEPLPAAWCSKCVFKAHGLYICYGGATTIELVDLNVMIKGAGVLRERIGGFVDAAHSFANTDFIDKEYEKLIPTCDAAESIRAIALEILFNHFKKSPDTFLKFVADIKKQHFQRGREFQAGKIREALGISDSFCLQPSSEVE